ncbi:sulfotransferase [Pilimelia columellifera]|uniref:Sulfotransferase n=1 Tax=Pilimelia columellifera subsp. columellifera TaxID=706583 RepID=A0ABN3NGI8_9ACTN
MDNDRPIFVVGCPRSGTTMLQLMLHAHPRIAIPPETRFLLEGYRERRRFGDLTNPGNRRRLAEWIVRRKQSRFDDLSLDPETVISEIVDGPPTLGSAVGAVFRAYARRFDKPRWGDKRPAYIAHLDVILRLFPTAQIINITRDGRDCVSSLKEMSWHKRGVPAAAAAWARAVDRAAEAARSLPAATYHQLRYEDLVSDPETSLRAICEFLDEPYDPAMTEPAKVAKIAVPKHKTWHQRTHQAVSTARVQSWRSRLTPTELGLCETTLRRRLAVNGYPPAEPDASSRPKTGDLLRYRIEVARHDLGRLRRAARHTVDRWTGAAPVEDQRTTTFRR